MAPWNKVGKGSRQIGFVTSGNGLAHQFGGSGPCGGAWQRPGSNFGPGWLRSAGLRVAWLPPALVPLGARRVRFAGAALLSVPN